MAGVSNIALREELLKRFDNLEDKFHDLDKKLDTHIALTKQQAKCVDDLDKDINGSNGDGIKYRVRTLWEKREENRQIGIGLKMAIGGGIIGGVLSAVDLVTRFGIK